MCSVATKFTIAVPTHDRRETVLLAVRSALAQTRPPEQVIVLCDGCTDGTPDAIRDMEDDRVVTIELPKLPGYGYAHRNYPLGQARGDVITWLADDDLLLPDHLERIGEYWDSGTVDFLAAPAVVVSKDDGLMWYGCDLSVPRSREAMMASNSNVMTSISVPVKLAREVGGWDGSQICMGDWDLWKRILAAGARPSMTCEPTVLHFQAKDREQAWSLRVRQNTEWFERTLVDDSLAALRRQLRYARSEHEASVVASVAEVEQYAFTLEGQVSELQTEVNSLRSQIAAQPAPADVELRRLYKVERTLYRHAAGGWRTLRRRIVLLMRLPGRTR